MIANYGYKDGSGEYYISIDTDKCIGCTAGRACLNACPKQMFEIAKPIIGARTHERVITSLQPSRSSRKKCWR